MVRNLLNNPRLLTFTFSFACCSTFNFHLCRRARFQRLLKVGLQTAAVGCLAPVTELSAGSDK